MLECGIFWPGNLDSEPKKMAEFRYLNLLLEAKVMFRIGRQFVCGEDLRAPATSGGGTSQMFHN